MNIYKISGMTCQGCVLKVKKTIENIEEGINVDVQLDPPMLKVYGNVTLDLKKVNARLAQEGKYRIALLADQSENKKEKKTNKYKPLFLLVSFIALVTTLVQYPFYDFGVFTWMRHFMAGFFLSFSFFKFLNLKGFASAYARYDIIAKIWYPWGYIYPCIELSLGLSYLINAFPWSTNLISIVVMGVGSVGVIESNLRKNKIQCACLGDVFDLPMSTITIVENLSMVIMALGMLLYA